MHRIDSRGSILGRFTGGNPNTGQPATVVSAEWLNDMQEQLCYVIEEADIALVKGDPAQLAQAIALLVAGAVGDGAGATPTTRLIGTAGLASGGGNLAVDRTITVAKASGAEVAAGVRDDVAITPLALQGGLGSRLLESDGYAHILGILFQWGTTTVPGNGYRTVTLPVAFPAQCVSAFVNGGSPGANAQDNPPHVTGWSASSVTMFSSIDATVNANWLAFGF